MRKAGLCKFEIEAADIFINLLMLIELQNYSGKVYGLLFVSPRHLRMEEVVDRLYLSKGAASEDLKLLRSLRVANAVYCPAVPRDHFAARTEQVQSGFDRLQGALERIQPTESLFVQMPVVERIDSSIGLRSETIYCPGCFDFW